MVEAIILAGGYSSRTGNNKLLLPYKDHSIIEALIKVLMIHCNRIILVTGHYHDSLIKALSKYPLEFVYNEAYDKGMFSSVLKGVSETTTDFLIIPGDYPMINPSTILRLVETSGAIVVPTFKGRRGHPILINKHLKTPLLSEGTSSNLKVFRDKYPVKYIEVEDEGILMDVDTMADYQLISLQEKRDSREN